VGGRHCHRNRGRARGHSLIHVLLLTTPRPFGFFGWIIALATLAAMLFPFSTTAPLSQKFATGAVNLFIGIAIGSLLTGVGNRSI